MVILLFEGLDNVGKSTMVNKFAQEFSSLYNVFIMHSRLPSPCEGVTPFEYQKMEFMNKAKLISGMQYWETSMYNNHPLQEMMILMDRSWLDEYVYGPIYRNENKEEIKQLIENCFSTCYNVSDIYSALAQSKESMNIKICVVHLLTESLDFAIKHDDGKSFTSEMDSAEKLSKVFDEYKAFIEICEWSRNKCLASYIQVPVTHTIKGKNGYPSFEKYYDVQSIFNTCTLKLKEAKII